MHRIAGLSLLAALAGCAAGGSASPTATVGEVVPADRVLALWSGNTTRGTTADGGRFSVYVAADGSQRLRVTLPNGRVISEQGRVTIQNGLICSSWANIRGGEPRCVETRRDGETFRGYLDGRLNSTYTIHPGNPDVL